MCGQCKLDTADGFKGLEEGWSGRDEYDQNILSLNFEELI